MDFKCKVFPFMDPLMDPLMDRPEHTTPSQSSICSPQGDTPTVQETTRFLPRVDFGNVVEHPWALFFVSALLNVGAGLMDNTYENFLWRW